MLHLEKLRAQSPLIHNITNYVVMNYTANALLAIGASPVMAHAKEEVEDMSRIAGATVLNMGTLEPQWVEAMLLAGKTAKALGKPLVFDPVGVGATPYRNRAAAQILETCPPGIIRGNASEIKALAGATQATKGVDSTIASDEALLSARALAKTNKAVVVISGATDYITDGEQVLEVGLGDALMPCITGMGCTATALIAAFAAVADSSIDAAHQAMFCMAVAGQNAAKRASGPGTFQAHFLDALYELKNEDLEAVL